MAIPAGGKVKTPRVKKDTRSAATSRAPNAEMEWRSDADGVTGHWPETHIGHRLVASLDLTSEHPAHVFRCSCGFGCVKGVLANPVSEVLGMIRQHVEAVQNGAA